MENSSSTLGWSVTGSICERAAAPAEPPVVWVRHAVLGGGRLVEGTGDGVIRGVLAVRVGPGRYQVADSDLVLGEGDTVISCDSPEDDRLHGLELLGCTETSGISQAATAAPRAYDGPLVGLCEALEVNQPEPRDGGDEIRRRFEGLARDLASAQGVRGLHLVVPGGDPA